MPKESYVRRVENISLKDIPQVGRNSLRMAVVFPTPLRSRLDHHHVSLLPRAWCTREAFCTARKYTEFTPGRTSTRHRSAQFLTTSASSLRDASCGCFFPALPQRPVVTLR